jgi:hypothetical protein
MKKFLPVLAVLLLSISTHAQYKKASFFGKLGRTYEVGSQVYLLGDGKGSPIGFKIGFGLDQEGKRLFGSQELQLIPSYKFSYTTTDYYDNPVTVSGTTKIHFIYSLNYGYYLGKNDGEPAKVQPYVIAGVMTGFSSGVKTLTQTPGTFDLKKQPAEESLNLGIVGGVGALINFTPVLGLKLQGGYSYQIPLRSGYGGSDGETFYIFTSHPYASVSLRIRIAGE